MDQRYCIIKGISILFVFQCMCFLMGCNNRANNPKEASQKLLAAKSWKIDQIVVNDAITFKDGKMIQQFGGIDFDRYMETVQFNADGSFEGIFKGDTKPMILHWQENPTDVSVSAKDQNGGAWTILPTDVTNDSFSMSTQSTAYDYPRMTKVVLIFKAND